MKQRGCWNFAALGRKFIVEKDGLSFYDLPVKDRVTAITKLQTNYQFIWKTLEVRRLQVTTRLWSHLKSFESNLTHMTPSLLHLLVSELIDCSPVVQENFNIQQSLPA
jgi:hypothetical protein